MRSKDDIRTVQIGITGVVEIDLERAEQDPVWESVARDCGDLNDPEVWARAVGQYVCRYLGQENWLENAPFTNGPAAIVGVSAEVK